MRLIKALIGGLIGAALSVALIVGLGVYVFTGVEMWLAIVAGIITGLGVRLMGKSDKPGPCYLCGAIAALLTMAAVYASTEGFRRVVDAQNEKTQIKLRADSLPSDMTTPPEVVGEAEIEVATDPEETADAADDPAAEGPTDGEEATDDPATDDPAADESAATEEPAGDETAEDDAEVVEEDAEAVVAAPDADATVPRAIIEGKPRRDLDFSWIDYVFIAVGALIAYELGRSCGCSKPAV